jgi:hypothetical protein
MHTCKICNSPTHQIFSKMVLNRYPADYFKCTHCNFVQTSAPVWLKEAYTSAITSLDIGLISRNIYLNEQVARIIDTFFPESQTMVDYGGGYGMFVRMMRDKGYNFYRQDLYCENLFAAYFDLEDAPGTRFDLLTSFEVFEHLLEPLEEVENMFRLSDTIIFTTLLTPSNIKDLEDWWYISPLTGQHIALYDKKTLNYIAEKFGRNLYTNDNNLHIMTDKKLSLALLDQVFSKVSNSLTSRLKNRLLGKSHITSPRSSLLQADYNYIEEKLKKS